MPTPAPVEQNAPSRILIADDQPDIREALRLLLAGEGFGSIGAASPDHAIELLSTEPFDLVLMDLNYARDTTSGREGIDLVQRIHGVDASLPIVVMTGWATVELSVEAMRTGASDFIMKPWENHRLLETVTREVRSGRERRRVSRDHDRAIEDARHAQQTLLPKTLPQLRGWSLAAACQPAGEIGGDYFDAIALGSSRVAVCVADVIGKGVSAALVMSNLQGLLRSIVRDALGPAKVCARLNRLMCRSLDGGRFVTFFYGVLDIDAGTFTFCNAGHNPALLYQPEGRCERLSEGGMVLGLFPEAEFVDRITSVGPGARLLLYTDGITEAEDTACDSFGDERLLASLSEHAHLQAHDLLNTVFSTVRTFTGNQFHDDATVMVLAAQNQSFNAN